MKFIESMLRDTKETVVIILVTLNFKAIDTRNQEILQHLLCMFILFCKYFLKPTELFTSSDQALQIVKHFHWEPVYSHSSFGLGFSFFEQ